MRRKSQTRVASIAQHQEFQIILNRLHAQKSVLEQRLKKSSNVQRRARTRTLIQMGALLTLTDLPSIVGIEEGDDLQFDLRMMDKAATLLGIILSLRDYLSPTLSNEEYETFKKLGLRHMKRQTSKIKE